MDVVQRRWWALAGLTVGVLAVGLDMTVLSVALPTLATSLRASEADLQWFSSGYMLMLASGMLPAGLLGDRYGRRRLMLVSLALFGLGSAACAYSRSPGEFVAARLLLGLAGAGVVVMALSAVTVLFDESERSRAVGVWAAANFLALPIGPILGGWLLSRYWWGCVFLLNVPVAVAGLLATVAWVPESRAPHPPAVDWWGLVSATTGLAAVTYGLIEAGQHGWASPSTLLPLVVGGVLLVVFAVWQRTLAARPGGQPLLDPALFHSASYTWGIVLAAVAVLAMVGVLFALPQYFQGVLGTDAMGSGLRLLPLIGGLVLGLAPAEWLAARLGASRSATLGFVALAAGLLLGSRTVLSSPFSFVLAWTMVAGFGMGVAMATVASAALAALPPERSGIGSAVLQALNKTGGPLGAAVVGTVLTGGYVAHLHLAGLPAGAARGARQSVFGGLAVAQQLHSAGLLDAVQRGFLDGMSRALVVSAAVAVAGALLAVLFLPRHTAGTPRTHETERPEQAREGVGVGSR